MMTKERKMEIMNITKNSMMNIGLVIILLGGTWMAASSQATIKAELKHHEALESHEGTKDMFVPKAEVDLQFQSVQRQLNELKAGQTEILNEIKK